MIRYIADTGLVCSQSGAAECSIAHHSAHDWRLKCDSQRRRGLQEAALAQLARDAKSSSQAGGSYAALSRCDEQLHEQNAASDTAAEAVTDALCLPFAAMPKLARHGSQACIAAGPAAGVQCPIAQAAAAHSP